jgi:protein ImuA
LLCKGFRPLLDSQQKIDLGIINHSFPNTQFPLGVNHEFICNSSECLTASSGFIAGILSSLLQKGGAVIWISSSQIIFPPALVSFGINPAQIIFIHLRNQKEILWTVEEALKCEGMTAVIGEVSCVDLIISRTITISSGTKQG